MKSKAVPLLAALCVILAALAAVAALRLARAREALSEAQAQLAAATSALREAESADETLRAQLGDAEQEALALRAEAAAEAAGLSGAAEAAEARAAALAEELAPVRRAQAVAEHAALTEHTLRTTHIGAFRYLLYEPGVPSDDLLPLLLFLHGSGGCLTDAADIFSDDTLPTMLARGWLCPDALVLIPQCPTDSWAPYCADLMELLEQVAGEYGADRARISVTGFSLGGMGCFSMLTRYPDYFSAAMPLAALCDPNACAVITSTPVRILHGAQDRTMDPAFVTLANDIINAAGGESTLTFLPGEGHFIQQHYLDDGGEPVEWLISQRRE